MAENEELNFDFDPDNIPDTNTFWNGLDAYWHANRQFPQGTDQKLSKKADLIDGKIPSFQLPSYVDDVLEFDSFGDLPSPGEQGKIYVTTDKNSILRWNGTEYIQLNSEIDGEIVVQSVPNSTGTVLTYNPTTKKVSTRTNAEIISDMSLMTTNTEQNVLGRKYFYTVSGNDSTNSSLWIRSDDGSLPGISFFRPGIDVGQIKYVNSGEGFYFTNSPNSDTIPVNAKGFRKSGSSDSYLLLGGGGHKLITDFATVSDLSSYHKRDSSLGLNNVSDTHTNQTWFDYNWAGTDAKGSVINFSGFSGGYSVELFGEYTYGGNRFGLRTKNGDNNTWNDPRWLWHDKNFNPATKVDVSQLANYVTLNTEQLISARKVIHKDLGTNDYINTAQHFSQFQIGRLSDEKSLEFAVLDNGVSVIQSKEVGVGYNPLILNRNNSGGVAIGSTPVAGHGLTVSGSIYSTENFYGNGFRKFGSNDGWVLLGGGHKLITDFATVSDLSSYHKRDSSLGLNNVSDTHTNQTWFDYNWAGTGELGSVINYSGLGSQYSTEVFGSYNNPDKVAIRTRQGDINAWNEPRWLWHDKNFNPATKADVSQLANYLPLTGGTLSGGGRIDQFGNIFVQQNNNGGNATGIFWESLDNSQFIGGIGAYTENGIFGNHYLGWGATPWSTATSLAVGENIFTYKNNQVWHEGNLIPHKQRQILLTSDTNNIEANSSGALYYNNLANSPYPSSQDIVGSISNFGGKTYGYDFANVRLGGNRLYFRDYYGNNPSAWNEIYHTGNFNPDTKADVSQLLNYWEKKDIAGIYWALDSNRDLGVLNGQQAQRLLTGGLLVSNAYSDAQFIPTNGIYSRGNISTLNYGSAIDWAIAATWTQTQGATMTWVSQNFINQSSLNTQLSNYATLNGVQTFTNTNTFLQSPIIPNATLGNHAVNLNQADGRYVNMLYDQNIGGIKNFTGAYTQWVLNGDSNNAIAFVQSLSDSVALGSLNNNDVGIYRNIALKLNFKENEAEFTDNVKIPNGILASHAVNLSQLNSAIGSHTHTFASLTSKPTTLSGYGITDAIPTSHPVNGVNTTQINNWNSAFGWGNHAVAGYATSDFVDESIAQITAEFINPDYPISTSCKVNTVIITEEFTQEYVTLEDELLPERQITITNLSPNNIGVIREDKKIDTISPGETTEYYITSEKRLVKKGTYKGAVFLN